MSSLALALGIGLGAGGEFATAQPHHPLANAWFNAHEGISNNRSLWGIKFLPLMSFSQVPEPWTSDVPGLYYVDPTHPSAVPDINPQQTEPSRPYGNPTAPRKKFPQNIEAGSIVYF